MDVDVPVPILPLPDPPRPILHECVHNQQAFLMSGADFNPRTGTVDLVRRDNAEQAYMIDEALEPVHLDSYGPGGGIMFFAIKFPVIGNGMYQLPLFEEGTERVAIKRLNLNAVETALQHGSFEDPYREIHRMQIGDNMHVLGCIEALKDEEYMYIVMPYCPESLVDYDNVPQFLALTAFSRTLDILDYIHNQDPQICHRNLSPKKFRIYEERIVLSGLGRSFQVSPGLSSVVIPDTENHGEFAFQAPEVFQRLPYDFRQCDLWATALTFFYLLTSELLYDFPHVDDLTFKCFILAQGIAGEENNWIRRCLEDADLVEQEGYDETNQAQRDHHAALIRQGRRLRPVFETIQRQTPEVQRILSNLLNSDPNERWDLDFTRATVRSMINPG